MGFERRPLEEIVEDILDRRGVTPTKLGGEFVSSGHRVISAKLIKDGRIALDADEPRFISSDMYARWMKTPLKRGDVVMTSEAPLGELAYLDESVDWVLGQRLFAIRPRKEVVGGRFLYYALASPEVRDAIFSRASGSTVQGIRQAELRKVEVPVPPMSVQFEVESLLGSLDERIDTLRRSSSVCEAIAQALFKSWFVDFDPVRAKAEGREPEGMDAATAELFPADFDGAQAGLIPAGWRLIRYGDVASLAKGTAKPQAMPTTEFQHYSLPAFDAHKLPVTELGETIRSNKTPVPSGAVLVSKLNPHIPRIWFVGDVADNSVCSTEFLVWTPKAGAGSAFVYCLGASQVFNSAMRQLVTGTSNSHQRVKPDQLAEVEVVAASDEVIAAFETLAAPLLSKVHHNRQRVATLAQLRDTLLPRLISGKLRLPDAEREIEAATA